MGAASHVLIAGATGLVGAAAVGHFASRPNTTVTALSRRQPHRTDVRHLRLDLTDKADVTGALADVPPITDVVFAALYEKADLIDGWRDPDQIATNTVMLENMLDGLTAHDSSLRHISLMQGTKAYGAHIQRLDVPAKERWPRHDHQNFYWHQEDLLRQRQEQAGWTYTIFRPQIVFGAHAGGAMNLTLALAVYASLMKARGNGLSFPGGGAYVTEATDTALLAEGFAWAMQADSARNETFNITNGDVFIWQNLWPAIADFFEMNVAPPVEQSLASEMPTLAAYWADLGVQHGLVEPDLGQLMGQSWQFADFNFAAGMEPGPCLVSTIKLRKAGFTACRDTEDMLLDQFARLREMRIIP